MPDAVNGLALSRVCLINKDKEPSLVLLAQYLPGKAIGQGRRLITEH